MPNAEEYLPTYILPFILVIIHSSGIIYRLHFLLVICVFTILVLDKTIELL